MTCVNQFHFSGTDFGPYSADELCPDFREALIDCGGSGDALPAVQYVLANFEISGDEENCRDYLRQYGAWEDDELQDHDRNLERLVWMAGCDLAEQGEAHFSTY